LAFNFELVANKSQYKKLRVATQWSTLSFLYWLLFSEMLKNSKTTYLFLQEQILVKEKGRKNYSKFLKWILQNQLTIQQTCEAAPVPVQNEDKAHKP